ncbi:hypothetical protein F8161_19620 [Bacillus cereus]|uniref:DUF4367 domain-containing protein n=2 Tax=Bacillus cereus group TaxID=86661 RepID=A0A7V7S2E7_9BACI|nr:MULTISPECIES: hypothetical protein [Bacillus cereus group]KAB2439719.1 hypothetical protein F8163_27190 [Bacillus luti]KAB2458636.1 hypothetical protein F8161_19620 [Bacillus cereus]OUB48441.1 hypothetical protein BK716_19515 [Bacillus thuringiensis serovar higo]
MKRLWFVILFFITMLTGCSVKDVNWYPVSQEVMATAPKELPFPISYPTKLPFEVDSITVTDENAEHVTIVYSSKDNQNLIVEITRGKDVFSQQSLQEINAFDKTRQAFNQQTNELHYVYWNEKDVQYQIYSSNENKKQLTKDELRTVQKSFSVK